MIAGLRSRAGLARSLAIYRTRPWKIARLGRFYGGFLAPGALAFDIGAHVGNRSRALRRAGARVVALEPQPLLHAFLRRELGDEVTLLKLAAGPAPGEARMAMSRLHPTVSTLAADFPARMARARGFEAVRWDHAEPVEVTTLDALIARFGRPDFIKIDVEGFEAEVLAGLSEAVQWIAFEHLAGEAEASRAALARLAALGRYRFNFVAGECAAFALPSWADADSILAAVAATGARSGDIYARLGAG